jgi:hypothetical protein
MPSLRLTLDSMFGKIQVSAKTGQNVEEAFLRTAHKIYDNIQVFFQKENKI